MRAAVIDIGSNSTKLIVGQTKGNSVEILDSLKNVIPIGRSTFYQGRISQEVFNNVIHVLLKYKRIIKEYGIEAPKVIATTAVREAVNRDIFLDTILRKTGLSVEVLNVGDVVYYIDTFLSYKLEKTYPINEKNLLIAELGAGSLDISIMEKGFTLMNIGLPIGTSRIKQFKTKVEGSQKQRYTALEEYVDNEITHLKRNFSRIKIDDVVLIDDTYSQYLHRILPNKNRKNVFFSFQHNEAQRLYKKITEMTTEELVEKHQIPAESIDAIDGYAILLKKLFNLVKKRSFYILETSLSEALISDTLLGLNLDNKFSKEAQLESVAQFLCKKFDADLRHAKHVVYLCEKLFEQCQKFLGLEQGDLLYLKLAAYLHNIGRLVNNRGHHKHAEYIISSLNLFRLTQQEINVIACVARYHRKAIPQKSHILFNTLSTEQKLLVHKLSGLLRLANALDASHRQKVENLDVAFSKQRDITITVYTKKDLSLEKVYVDDARRLIEDISGLKMNLITKREV